MWWKKLQKHKYVAGTVEASATVYQEFQKRRRQLIRMSLLSAALTFASLGIVGLQLFYPFHLFLGIGLYIISFVPFIRRVYLSRDTWRKYHAYKLTKNFVKKERRRFVFAVLIFIAIAIFFWLRPVDKQPFDGMTNEQIVALVEDDLYRSVTAMDYLETSGNELLEVLARNDADSNQTEDIDLAFATFLDAVAYSESLTETHRYFAGIPYAEWGTRVESFLIANSLYAKKYELIQRIMISVSGSDFKKTALNQYVPAFDRANIYNEMVVRYFEPKTRVRLVGGYLYQQLFVTDRSNADLAYMLLRDKAAGSFDYLRSNAFSSVLHAPEVLTDNAERRMFEAWFPVQKGVATAMGRAILSTRGKEGLITPEQAIAMSEQMLPGDIMLQRRNWHVSNVGIPGFWTHSALYTGTLEEMDEYFASEFPYEGYESMSAYMAAETPVAYAAFTEVAAAGESPSVIEAIEPGVVAQTIVKSADADFVVVLRPELAKQDKMLALMKAFANAGKPYDFNFDFNTRDALVCSELVYDAYYERLPEKNGLHMETSLVNGRPIVSPLDIATKYVAERNTEEQELRFVYFIGSSEDTKEAFMLTESDFVDSLEWSKFSFLQTEVE
ncbi:MAG: hypothetical protein KC877_04445 [Candidatus Kaiserbacteria bacterium]|nr:hypothetical protein [Candidatus Kaiserbacteria bacterium]MCB9816568.1 hypothetical protein [Candidatus Nomurabacteria bacterium]